jgi:DHA1 family quinolone resistance protein-like MFS transporter
MRSTHQIQRVYYLIISLFWLSTALPMSLMVLFIQSRGLDLFQVGAAMGVYSLTIVLLEVPTGGLADAMGRKRVALVAYGCLALASCAFLFAFSFPAMLAAFILYGTGRALSSGALDAWFVDALQKADPQIDLQPALAKAGTFTFLSLGLGTLLGSSIPLLFKGLLTNRYAFLTPLSIPILFAIVVKIALLLLTFLLVKEEPGSTTSASWKIGLSDVPQIVRTGFALSRSNPTLLLLLGATSVGGFVVAGLEAFWQPNFANMLGGSEGKSLFFGIIMGGNFLVGMLGNLLATPVSRHLKKRFGLVCAAFQGAWGIAIILLSMQVYPVPAALFFWLAYLNMGILDSPHNTLLNREIPSEQRSSMLSISSLSGYIGAMIGSVGLGYIAEHASINTAWMISGMVMLASFVLYWKVDRRQSEKQIQLQQALADASREF